MAKWYVNSPKAICHSFDEFLDKGNLALYKGEVAFFNIIYARIIRKESTMKKGILRLVTGLCVAVLLVGCGAKQESGETAVKSSSQGQEAEQKEGDAEAGSLDEKSRFG